MMKKIILIISIILTISASGNTSGNGGSYGAVYKNRGTAGYFSTGKAIAENGADYIFYNPAGLIEPEKSEITMTGAKLFNEIDGFKQIQAGGIYKYDKGKTKYSFGIDYSSFNINGIREATGSTSNSGILTGNMYDASFSSITLAGAQKINDKFNAGMSLIFYNQEIYNRSYKNTVINAGGNITLKIYLLI